MGFSFLHTADWHIGKSFGSFSSEQQPLLRQARLDAIGRLGEAARARNSRHVIVCGDIFDSPGIADRVINQAMAAMAGQTGVTWHLLPGNHDPDRPGGIWQRVAAMSMPGNVAVLQTAQPLEVEAGVMLLPAPLSAKAIAHDPTGWMDGAVTSAGAIRIGVAHGSTQGFGSRGAASVGISPSRRASARLDYLALGDWHGVKEIAAGVWYAGTPEPDQFPDNEPGYALAVTVPGAGAPPNVERVATAKYVWSRRSVLVRSADDVTPIEQWVDGLGAAAAMHLLEIVIGGMVSITDDAALRVRLTKLDGKLFHLRQTLDDLRFDAGPTDIEAVTDAELKSVAEKLVGMRGQAGTAVPQVVDEALRRLFQLAQIAETVR